MAGGEGRGREGRWPIAAAELGQVRRTVLYSGQEVRRGGRWGEVTSLLWIVCPPGCPVQVVVKVHLAATYPHPPSSSCALLTCNLCLPTCPSQHPHPLRTLAAILTCNPSILLIIFSQYHIFMMYINTYDIYTIYICITMSPPTISERSLPLCPGPQVVVKVQRPGLKQLFDIDLENLRLLAEQLDRGDENRDFKVGGGARMRVCAFVCACVCVCARVRVHTHF